MKLTALDIMKYKMRYIISFALIFALNIGFCQTKQERETQIEKHELPEKIIAFANLLPEKTKRLRFYKETDGKQESFEVKFKYQKSAYSCEFNTNGLLEDIEVALKEKHLDTVVANTINQYFDANFDRNKIIKIQKQFVNDSTKSTLNFLSKIIRDSDTANINYEIIAEVTKDKKRNLREFTFNHKGEFLSFRIVVPSSYGYVLY